MQRHHVESCRSTVLLTILIKHNNLPVLPLTAVAILYVSKTKHTLFFVAAESSTPQTPSHHAPLGKEILSLAYRALQPRRFFYTLIYKV